MATTQTNSKVIPQEIVEEALALVGHSLPHFVNKSDGSYDVMVGRDNMIGPSMEIYINANSPHEIVIDTEPKIQRGRFVPVENLVSHINVCESNFAYFIYNVYSYTAYDLVYVGHSINNIAHPDVSDVQNWLLDNITCFKYWMPRIEVIATTSTPITCLMEPRNGPLPSSSTFRDFIKNHSAIWV